MSELEILPNYDRPPLIEVALAVGFEAKKKVDVAHLGAFWHSVRKEFPSTRSLPPITAHLEDFGKRWTQRSIQVEFSDQPDYRLQMTTDEGNGPWMWQVQSDLLVVNWRKKPCSDYPRYSITLEHFRDAWHQWNRFLKDIVATDILPSTWEVTYVNEILSGENELWQSPDQWSEVLPGLFGSPCTINKDLEFDGLQSEWVWRHNSPPAHLSIRIMPIKRNTKNPILQVALTAKGRVDLSSTSEIADSVHLYEAGLNLGHRLIVNSFDRLGSDAAKKHWRRK